MAKEITDKDRMDWIERNFGMALLDDDNGHWAVSFSGAQNVPEGEGPQDIWTSFFVKSDEWHPTAREAIDAAICDDHETLQLAHVSSDPEPQDDASASADSCARKAEGMPSGDESG